jgi:hypothetical protein
MWKVLGVRGSGDEVELDDGAPESALRRAITSP